MTWPGSRIPCRQFVLHQRGFLLPLLQIGTAGFRRIFNSPFPIIGRPNGLGVLLLTGSPLSFALMRFPTEIRSRSLPFLNFPALYAAANRRMEEVLRRATFVAALPASWLLGSFYRSLLLGLRCGSVSEATQSIRWTVAAHILPNFEGPSGRRFISRGPACKSACYSGVLLATGRDMRKAG